MPADQHATHAAPQPAAPPPVAWMRRQIDAFRARDIGIRAIALGPDWLFVDTPDRYGAALAWKMRWRDGAAQRLMARAVKPGMVAVDVGANVGWYTLALARCVGADGRVYALEPDARCFELLGRTAGRCPQIELRQVAAADYSGWTTLYLAEIDQGDHRIVPAAVERRMVTVRAVSLDDLLSEAPRVDFLKLAVQGAEVSVLRGLRRILARRPELQLLCAVAPALLERAGAGADALFEPLCDAGFVPHQLWRDGSTEPIHPRLAWSRARALGRMLVYFRRG